MKKKSFLAEKTGIWFQERWKRQNFEDDSEFSLRDILKSSAGTKTDFMYSVIMNNLLNKMEPNYISEGLEWLMK